MSDSRLEKFIYAICSMDVSDLPVPLSRIEKLWNCLITGETPDFEPLSRNEKYLMAMLDRYDISNLPAPMSRGEKLLYKIAVGETDLSDVPGYLSRYEELLKYLIENGEISEDDFEYVLYTLNQSLSTLYPTAEKPVKSAILKGDSQRVFSPTKNLFDGELEQGTISSSTGNNSVLSTAIRSKNFVEIGVNTAFTLSRKKGTASLGFRCYDKNKNFLGTIFTAINGGTLKVTYTTDSNTVYIRFIDNTNDLTNKYQIEIGSTATDYEEPNYELKSVKMPVLTTTGKNLLDISNFKKGGWNWDIGTPETDDLNTYRSVINGYIEVKPNTYYTLSQYGANNTLWFSTLEFDANFTKVGQTDQTGITKTFHTQADTKYLRVMFQYPLTDLPKYQQQLEEGSTATSYEPFKTNILTCNEEVTLRKVGEVQDELNVMTGELTERIGEVVFDGSENWISHGTKTNTNIFRLAYSKLVHNDNYILCDKLPIAAPGDVEKIATSRNNGPEDCYAFYIALSKTKANTLSDFKSYLSKNPLTVQYELKTPTTKTVDLSVVDQDNQPTQLETFENITHVSLEAENLIPEAELEVATRISEELASASPLMDDISTKQERLNTTIDEQSENVDATMIATTEIFEEIL